jgi:hypothetical protein
MIRPECVLAVICALMLGCISITHPERPSILDVACNRMLMDDPALRFESIVDFGETTPRFYYGALLTAMHARATIDAVMEAARLDAELTRLFVPAGLPPPVKCRMTKISPLERRRHWNDWLVEVSPIVKNIYASTEENGVFARGTLGGGQSGRYYWIQIKPNGTAGRVLALDVSETP